MKTLVITLLTTRWSNILINLNILRLLKPKGGQNDINDKLQELIKLREDILKAKEQVLEDEPPPSDYIPRRLRPKPIPFEDSNLEVRTLVRTLVNGFPINSPNLKHPLPK